VQSHDYEGLQNRIRELKLPAIETFANLYSERDYEVRLEVPEFTCICPRTSLPDFATLRIVYVPDQLCVELKSLKHYLHAFRSVGIFHENVVNRVLDDLAQVLRPRRLEVEGEFRPRGGITTTVRASLGRD
jgi:7-cyano-7-deazaguanine reductase